MPPQPPRTRAQLFQAVRDVVAHGWYDVPLGPPRYNGAGTPGNFLEDLLGLTTGSADIPDAVGWELKWYTLKTHLITLFHKNPDGPDKIMRYMVRKYGWLDAHGRRAFRHTIKGQSDRFKVVEDSNQLIVRPLRGNGSVPYWRLEELMGAVGSKLRRVLLVRGEYRKADRRIRFARADAYETFNLIDFAYEVTRGTIAVDFDARERKPGSSGLRDHGVKFRIPPDAVCRLYMKKERL